MAAKTFDILLADDERAVRDPLAALLRGAGYDVRTARDGAAALAAFRERTPDLALLDVMMPKMDGFAVCRAIRETDAATPVLFLTALSSDADHLRGLGAGADDYLFKSAPPAILLARVAAALRRASAASASGDFSFGGWRADAARLELHRPSGERLRVSGRELALLRLFAEHPREVLARDWLLDRLWDDARDVSDNLLSVTVCLLREKLGAEGAAIRTVRSAGYAFRPPPPGTATPPEVLV